MQALTYVAPPRKSSVGGTHPASHIRAARWQRLEKALAGEVAPRATAAARDVVAASGVFQPQRTNGKPLSSSDSLLKLAAT
ncbi:MAG: hypothetical protein M3Q08_10530 [Pseudomonadota bacterium]|nr:hypothetical protein [Pseudomonadota bacterium]